MPGKRVHPVLLPANEEVMDHPIEWWYFICFLDGPQATDRFALEMTAARLSVAPLRAIETVYLALIDLHAREYVSADRQSMDAYQPGLGRVCLRFEAPFGQPGDWTLDGFTVPNLRYEMEAAFAVSTPNTSALQQRAVRLTLTDTAAHPPAR
jgi:hypothetical protein